MTVEDDILEEVLSALDHLLGDEPSASSACYRTLRLSSWAQMENLRDRIVEALAAGPGATLEMSDGETDLSAKVLECSESLRKQATEERDREISRAFAMTGIAGGIVGLLAYLLK